jgi:hypothetical protein
MTAVSRLRIGRFRSSVGVGIKEVRMNSGKHKKDLVQAWLCGEELPIPTRSRSVHLLETCVKISHPQAGRPPRRAVPPSSSEPRFDPLLMREPGTGAT